MDRQSDKYTIVYATVLVVLTALLLSFTALSLHGRQEENRANEKRADILASLGIYTENDRLIQMYDETITDAFILDRRGKRLKGEAFDVDVASQYMLAPEDRQLPVFVAEIDGDNKYIVPLYGKGLWGSIWGYLALDSDCNTVFGVVFDHEGETPGLGAEIAATPFCDRFYRKTLFEGKQLVCVKVKKGNGHHGAHEVDAISGGTMTSRGVEAMLQDYLALYEPFLREVKR